MSSPGIVLVSQYASGSSEKFSNYVNYIDRSEAVRTEKFTKYNLNQYDGYNQYMANPNKSRGIFTKNKDSLNRKEKEELKKIFETAQENESVMWQDVISFDNVWLEKNGLYDSKSGWVHEGAIQNAVREGMQTVLKEEGMEESGVWSASIHFNTDNIHVHIALVEPYPTREMGVFKDKETGEEYTARRGNRKKKTLDKFKSKVANTILDRDKELAKISHLIHKTIAPKELSFQPNLNTKMLRMYNDVYNKLPNDMRLWKYNNNALNDIRPELNQLISLYIEQNHKEDFQELDQALIEEMNFRKEVYGAGDQEKDRYKEYRDNKINELYAKLGNTILREMAEIKKEERASSYPKNGVSRKGDYGYKGDKQYGSKPIINRSDIYKIKKALDVDYQSIKNKRKYREMQRQIEYER
ncbi:MobP2 family relaxase [Bacillus sp. Au-Bac7]|uniref:MobP2 family relaxase n=1 Tax=Bacillus sp. Au-Bac7 TaxID=2906458 RepID=UPI001E379738|nr:MobP2 family relaxase [Bacillus sp. Au-Bac7]MCE4051668.1 relaxase MobL [Bacillus sp. Au-Bac7]